MWITLPPTYLAPESQLTSRYPPTNARFVGRKHKDRQKQRPAGVNGWWRRTRQGRRKTRFSDPLICGSGGQLACDRRVILLPPILETKSRILWMDEILHHLRNPGNDSPVNTNEQRFPLFPSGVNGFCAPTVPSRVAYTSRTGAAFRELAKTC